MTSTLKQSSNMWGGPDTHLESDTLYASWVREIKIRRKEILTKSRNPGSPYFLLMLIFFFFYANLAQFPEPWESQ